MAALRRTVQIYSDDALIITRLVLGMAQLPAQRADWSPWSPLPSAGTI